MQWLITIAVLSSIVGVMLWIWGRKPYKHRRVPQRDLRKYFEVLLKRGRNGGFIVIELPKDHRFIQFSKYILKKGSIGLQLDFPLAEWSKAYYRPLQETLRKAGTEFHLEPAENGDVKEFLVVDVGNDVDQALALSRLVLTDVFKTHDDGVLELHFHNVSPLDGRIG